MCCYLIRTKKQDQLRSRVKDLCGHKTSDNTIKHNIVPAMQETCGRVMPGEERPPLEREMSVMSNWLRKSLPFIHTAVMEYNKPYGKSPPRIPPHPPAPPYTFANGTRYPSSLPRNVTLRLHPCMNYKGERPPIAHKPRPFYPLTRGHHIGQGPKHYNLKGPAVVPGSFHSCPWSSAIVLPSTTVMARSWNRQSFPGRKSSSVLPRFSLRW